MDMIKSVFVSASVMDPDVFKSAQTNEPNRYVCDRYGNEPEYQWTKLIRHEPSNRLSVGTAAAGPAKKAVHPNAPAFILVLGLRHSPKITDATAK